MNRLLIASMHHGAGKTCITVGLLKASKRNVGYLKPFGDRLLYRKKRLWDHDTALLTTLFDLREKPADMTIGFEHAKLKYMYDPESMRKRVVESGESVEKGKDVLLIEGGCDLKCGISVHLDALSVAKYLDARLVMVVSGDEYTILDDIIFGKRYIETADVNFAGVIVNKVENVEDFRETHIPDLEAMGITVLGVVPYLPDLTYVSVQYLADRLFAKVIAGEAGLNRVVKNVFVGAASSSAARRNPLFKKEDKLIITGGDRSDMILAAIQSDASCVVLTNNILPPSNIVSKASEACIPLLLVPWDTYYTAGQIDHLETLLTPGDQEKIALLEQLVGENVSIERIVENQTER